MTVLMAIKCDVPDCFATPGLSGNIYLPDAKIRRADAAKDGWTTTRVPNPFPRNGAKTVVLDRCPEHAKTLLRAELVDELLYRIVLKEAR